MPSNWKFLASSSYVTRTLIQGTHPEPLLCSLFVVKCWGHSYSQSSAPRIEGVVSQNAFKSTRNRDFPGSPVVNTSPSKAGDVGSISGLRAKIHMFCDQKKKKTEHKTEAIL